jgi:TP901 family phage tail tape measure protein
MAQDAIHLLFDVEGGDDLSSGSGAEILRQLTSIVDQINHERRLPKIQLEFDAGNAVEELRKQLDGLSGDASGVRSLGETFKSMDVWLGDIAADTMVLREGFEKLNAELLEFINGVKTGVGDLSVLTNISTSLEKISSNTSSLEGIDNVLVHLLMTVGKSAQTLNDIFESMPDGANDSYASIKKVTDGVKQLVSQIGELSYVVEEISKKPTSVVQTFVGSANSEDLTRLELLKTRARELMNTFQELFATFDANYEAGKRSPLGDVFNQVYRSLGAKQDAYNAIHEASRNLAGARTDVDAATEAKDVNRVISLYSRLDNELHKLIVTANQSKGAGLPLPDVSRVRAAIEAIRAYDEEVAKRGDDTPSEEVSTEEGKSVLETARVISETFKDLEQMLDAIRAKIESTFDFSTVDLNTEALKNALQELVDLKAKVGDVSKVLKAAKAVKANKDDGRDYDSDKRHQEEAEMWEAYMRSKKQKTQEQIDSEIAMAYEAERKKEAIAEEAIERQARKEIEAYDRVLDQKEAEDQKWFERAAKAHGDSVRKAAAKQEAAERKAAAEQEAADRKAQKDAEDEALRAQNAKYQSLRGLIGEYYKLRKDLEKSALRDGSIADGEGNLDETKLLEEGNEAYEKRGRILEQIKTALADVHLLTRTSDGEELSVGAGLTDDKIVEGAEALGISAEQYKKLLLDIDVAARKLTADHERGVAAAASKWDKERAKARKVLADYKNLGADKNLRVAPIMDELEAITSDGSAPDLDKLNKKVQELRRVAAETGADIETFGNKLAKTFGGKVRAALAGIIVGKLSQSLHDVYRHVINLDKAITDLQIATGKTRQETAELVKSYSELGKQLGATTAEVAAGADTWLRQGFTIEQTNELLKNTMMLSKLGQIESAEASKALTSAMRGYKMEAQDTALIVDKLTAVDMEAAASAGGIATAMAETATGAKLAGVSMDQLIGYITTVAEVTQDEEESVGNFFKTLFARMGNVKAGKFIDDETGESLNDVEAVLGNIGISLRDANGNFRNFAEVLSEVAGEWENYDNVTQHAIATAFAGKLVPERTEMCA